MVRHYSLSVLSVLSLSLTIQAADWKPVGGQIMTPWAAKVRPHNVWAEYPRPQMVRDSWINLNGLWDYAIVPADADRPSSYDGKILVPFPVESALSGVKKPVRPDQAVWYRRTFRIPPDWQGTRVLLHFEAVDWHTRVWLNGEFVGEHKGGYDPFSFEVTEQLMREGDNELVVRVWDPTDQGWQPRGKQVLRPHGIWYTAVTGIWQTVWLEAVPRSFISSFRVYPKAATGEATFVVRTHGATNTARLELIVHRVSCRDTEERIKTVHARAGVGEPLRIRIPEPRLWSPQTPWLYHGQLRLLTDQGAIVDEVSLYFGLRDVAVRKASDGFNRLFLNGKPVFHFGPLDQGWWPDGLYTAPSDEALRFDVETMKKFQYNAVRKHVKVEPRRWYYWCDRLGLMVWQDMPSGDRFVRRGQPDIVRSKESAENFYREYEALIETHFNHPSIVMWVPFNEGWGQFETEKVVAFTKQQDPTRLVNNASGWEDRGVGDVIDIHRYPGPAMPQPEPKRAAVLGEFGGLGLPLPGHLWVQRENWGYRTYRSRAELERAYLELMAKLKPLIRNGLAAAIYTQLSDVEREVNGVLTYDRKVIKFDLPRITPVHDSFYELGSPK